MIAEKKDMAREKCRVWWPRSLSCKKPKSMLLFGWFIPSPFSNSLDIVVATGVPPHSFSLSKSYFQGALDSTNREMPLCLQDHFVFSTLGHFMADNELRNNMVLKNMNGNPKNEGFYSQTNKRVSRKSGLSIECNMPWNCGCQILDTSLEPYRQSSITTGNWIQLFDDSKGVACNGIQWVPKLHHMHKNGILSVSDVHVIIYEQPVCGLHHFSLNSWASSYEHLCASPSGQISHKKPRWIDELDQKQPFCNLNTVIAALNCSHAAKTIFWRNVIPQTRSVHVIAVSMMVASIWQIVAMTIASASTLYYVLLQCSNRFLNHCFPSLLHWMLNMLLDHTWKIVHIRSCQLLYWPIVLLGSSFRAQSCVEYVHRASLIRHSVWSSIIVDVLLGNVIGFILLGHVEEICFWVSHLVRDITNGLLRSGCVWLMGVPAGFKLNTELAEVIGMIALNAIQIWSTLWFFMNSFFAYFVKVLAISGILFGVTVPASLCIDLLSLSTLHIWALHWLISLIYSLQIQALASVWRLFRGRKWNPLRQRLDSYNYSVEQHVVGSLLFTPLLLLLPTTSVFYIFFTILYRTVSSIHFLMELAISFLHAAPYAEIFLWVVWPRMFPSGIWFKILSEHSESCRQSPKGNGRNDFIESSQDLGISRRMTTVVSILGSNSATIGQVLHPHSRKVFSGVSMSSVVSSAYGVFSGRRIPSALHAKLPLTLPWMSIGIREFWWLCCDSIRTRMRKF